MTTTSQPPIVNAESTEDLTRRLLADGLRSVNDAENLRQRLPPAEWERILLLRPRAGVLSSDGAVQVFALVNAPRENVSGLRLVVRDGKWVPEEPAGKFRRLRVAELLMDGNLAQLLALRSETARAEQVAIVKEFAEAVQRANAPAGDATGAAEKGAVATDGTADPKRDEAAPQNAPEDNGDAADREDEAGAAEEDEGPQAGAERAEAEGAHE